MALTVKETEGKPQMVVIETPNNPLRMEDVLHTRKTYRLFLDKPIEEGKKAELLKVFDSPTWIESDEDLRKFWGYKVVEDKETRTRIFEEAVYSRAASAVKSKAFDEMLNAPLHVVIYLNESEINKQKDKMDAFWQGVHDNSAASAMALNLAHELGFAGWWIGHMDNKKLSEVLDLPKGLLPTQILVFGYPRTDEKESRILREAGKSFPRAPPPEMIYFQDEFGKVYPPAKNFDTEKRVLIRFDEIPMFRRGIEKQIEVVSEKASEAERIEMSKIKERLFSLIDEDKPGLNDKVNKELQELFRIISDVQKRNISPK